MKPHIKVLNDRERIKAACDLFEQGKELSTLAIEFNVQVYEIEQEHKYREEKKE